MKVRTIALFAASSFLPGFLQAQNPSIYKVGLTQTYPTLSAAVSAAAANGGAADIQVDAGTYTDDFPQTITSNITIEGVGGIAKFVATQPPPNQKGILDVSGTVTLRYLDLSGAAVGDLNGAGIRYENGTLLVQNCFIHDNEVGLLANGDSAGSITIDHSEFAHNGNSEGDSHNIFMGGYPGTGDVVGKFTLTNSYIHDANPGSDEIKSDALVTDIENNRIFDNNSGSAYSINALAGGKVTIRNNIVEQGPNGQNPNFFAVGGGDTVYPGSSVTAAGNTIVNDLLSLNVRGFYNPTGIAISADGNKLYGILPGAFLRSASNTSLLLLRPALDMSSPIQDPAAPGAGISYTSWYELVNGNGSCLDDFASLKLNGAPVVSSVCAAQQFHEQWQFRPTDSGYYAILNRNVPGSGVTVGYPGTLGGAAVNLWQITGSATQQWLPVPVGNGLYQFVNRANGRCLNVSGAAANSGVQVSDCNGSGAQAFRLVLQP